MNRKQEAAWMAGFFDGEGCVSISKTREPRSTHGTVHKAMIQVANTDPLLLRMLKRWFEGSIYVVWTPKGNRRPVHAWRLFGHREIGLFCDTLEPLLQSRPKRRQMRVVMEFLETTKVRYSNHRPVPLSVWKRRERFYLKCSLLKGPAGRAAAA